MVCRRFDASPERAQGRSWAIIFCFVFSSNNWEYLKITITVTYQIHIHLIETKRDSIGRDKPSLPLRPQGHTALQQVSSRSPTR